MADHRSPSAHTCTPVDEDLNDIGEAVLACRSRGNIFARSCDPSARSTSLRNSVLTGKRARQFQISLVNPSAGLVVRFLEGGH